jgi:hypothetical protein
MLADAFAVLAPMFEYTVIGNTGAGRGMAAKVAVTAVGALIVMVQTPIPAQPPSDHPAKLDVPAADAVNVTEVPAAKLVVAPVHVVPQLMPPGDDVTVPLPVPDLETVRVKTLGETG